MELKIYFDAKPVYLCDALSPALKEILQHPDAVFIDELSAKAINSLLHEIKKDDFHAAVLCSPQYEKLKRDFFHHFTPIEAAGGIVQNEDKDILFMYRLDKWDLPKGKVETKEKIEVAAAREIAEETGIRRLQIKKKIGETYHTYHAFGKHYIKTTHWFYFVTEGEQDLQPQLEENITLLKWFNMKDIKMAMDNTYPSIRDIVSSFFDTP